MELSGQEKGKLGTGRLVERERFDVAGPWVEGVRGPLGPGESSMASTVPKLHPTQHAGTAGRLPAARGTGLCSDLQGTHPLPFVAGAGHGGHRPYSGILRDSEGG